MTQLRPKGEEKFVTVFQTTDVVFVEMMAVKLRDAGIVVTHPGTYHAAAFGRQPVIPISMQVPRSQAELARALIEEALPNESKAVDSSERKGKVGALLGLAAAIVICTVVSENHIGFGFLEVFGLLFAGALGGYLLDRWIRSQM